MIPVMLCLESMEIEKDSVSQELQHILVDF